MINRTVAVIGGGPGGYVATLKLERYGIDVVVFEKERLGGVCLNKGCIPTKALVKPAELFYEMKSAEEFGLSAENPTVDYPSVAERKQQVVEQLVGGIEFIYKKKNIPVVNHSVSSIRKTDEGYVITADQEYLAEYVILATGAAPIELPFMKFDGEIVCSSDHILSMTELPERLIVVGGGVIGCEFASAMNSFGVEVEIVEFLPRLVATEDEEVSKRLTMAFKKSGIKVHLKKAVEDCRIEDGKAILALSGGKELTADKVLVSVGRKPRLDIEFIDCRPAMEKGAVLIDDNMRTDRPKLYAIGDLTGKMQLAHVASKQGLRAVKDIKSRIEGSETTLPVIRYTDIPRCTFTHPEIGSAGLTEEQAKDFYGEILVGKFPFSANGKALGMGQSFGFVKTIADAKSHRIVGMHIIGANATELIAEGGILIQMNLTVEQASDIVYAHPTLSEAVAEAVEDLEGMALHKV